MEYNSPTKTSRGAVQKHIEDLHSSHENMSGGGGGGGGAVGGGNLTNGSYNLTDVTEIKSYTFGGVGGQQQQQQQQQQQIVEENFFVDKPFDLNERFVTLLDHLDANVEKFRKDAVSLQEKRDYLLMSIDLIKSNELLHAMSESERDEIDIYIQRLSARLGTVELNVRTVRDTSQEDSLSQVNTLIDLIITMGDPVFSRQRCQQYLNACCSSATETSDCDITHMSCSLENYFVKANASAGCVFGDSGGKETDLGPVDKKFESALLGCTLDDQKNIKKRLQALMDYLNKQTIGQSVEGKTSKHGVLVNKTSSHNKMQST